MYNTLPVSYIFRLLHSSTYPLSARPVWRNTAPSWRTTTPSARKSRLSDAIEIFIEFFPRHDRHYVQTDGVRVQIYHLHRYRWVPDGHHRIPVHCGSGDSDSVSELPPTVSLHGRSVDVVKNVSVFSVVQQALREVRANGDKLPPPVVPGGNYHRYQSRCWAIKAKNVCSPNKERHYCHLKPRGVL